MSEADLLASLQKQASKISNCLLFRNQTGSYHVGDRFIRSGLGGPGGPDLILVYDYKFIPIEVKSKSGKLSDSQIKYFDTFRTYGFCGFIIFEKSKWCFETTITDILKAVTLNTKPGVIYTNNTKMLHIPPSPLLWGTGLSEIVWGELCAKC